MFGFNMTTILALLIGLQIADAITTYKIISRGGREVNPVLVKLAELTRLFTNAKWAWLVIAKAVGIAASIYIALAWPSGAPVFVLLYVWVVIHNIDQLYNKG